MTWVILPIVVIAIALAALLMTVEVVGLVRAKKTGAYRQSFAKGPITDREREAFALHRDDPADPGDG